jgi:hypothetical protein
MLDTHPAYLRPAIMDILRQVNAAKQFTPSTLIILYTNNSNTQWIRFILHYINSYLNLQKPLFDHVWTRRSEHLSKKRAGFVAPIKPARKKKTINTVYFL